jgi:hypothetical protein
MYNPQTDEDGAILIFVLSHGFGYFSNLRIVPKKLYFLQTLFSENKALFTHKFLKLPSRLSTGESWATTKSWPGKARPT